MSAPTTAAPRRRFRIRGWIIVLVVILLVLLFSLRGLAGFYTDFLWFDSLRQGSTWSSLLAAKVAPALVFTVAFFIIMEVDEKDARIGHEATVSKVGDDQIFYLMSRGLTEQQATAMIVNGFIEPITKTLPMPPSGSHGPRGMIGGPSW